MAAWPQTEQGGEEAARRATELVFESFPVLRARADEEAGNLSGGEQQMHTLGQAFLSRPRLLMIDELSLGLAPIVVEELAQRLERLRADGIGVLLVEQEYPLALRLADHVYVLQKGRVAFEGAPEAARDVLMSSYLGRRRRPVGEARR